MSIDNVEDRIPRNQYEALPAQTVFDYTFPIFQDADIVIDVDGETQVLGTDYTVTGEGEDAGGEVTFLVALTGGEIVTIYRDIAIERTSDFQQNGPWTSSTLNDELDRITLILQQLESGQGRALRLPITAEATDAQIQFEPITSWLGKYVTINASGVPEPATLVSGTISRSIIGGLLNPQTGSEAVTPVDMAYPSAPEDIRRYGATDAGGITDSTDEIQDAVDTLDTGTIKGGAVVVPGDANSVYNISASITIPARASGDNHTRWMSLRGMGRGGPRITAKTGLEDDPIISAAGQDASTYSFYREFRDLYLNGAGIANRGIELYYNQHYLVQNVFITGLDDGTSPGSAAGVRTFGAICAQFIGLKVHNGDGYGIHGHGGSGNFFNANLIAGCSFLDLAADANYFSGGASGNAWIGNTFEDCEHGLRFAGYAGSVGWCGGNYFELNKAAEVYLGEETAHDNFTLEANYLNGYTGGTSNTDYTPVKMKFAAGCIIVGNLVAQAVKSTTGYYILDANISGGLVTDCVVANNRVRGLAASTAPKLVYNLPGGWVNNRNTLIDPVFAPLIQANMIPGRWPYGGWTLSVTGTGSAIRSGSDMFGAPALFMTRPPASTAEASQTFSIQAQYKNRFVTFAIPVTALATNEQLDVTVTPNGTSPQATTISESSMASGDTKMVYVLVFVPSDATTIGATISCASTDASFIIGHPCLYVGAQPWYSSDGDQDWRNDTAPTTGAWNDGDKVYLRNAVSGATMGYGCTASGSPGTWVNMPNYA